jgi:hypothetical protein
MVGYVAAGHKVIPPNRKNHRHTPVDRDHQNKAHHKAPAAGGLKLQSGYDLLAFQPAGILILFDAPFSS